MLSIAGPIHSTNEQRARRPRRGAGRLLVLVMTAAAVGATFNGAGCRDPHRGLLEATRAATEKALDAWQKRETRGAGELPAGGVVFHDEDAQIGATLLSGKIVRVYMDPDQTARAAVELTLQFADGKSETKNVTYQVVEKDGKMVIARDPFS